LPFSGIMPNVINYPHKISSFLCGTEVPLLALQFWGPNIPHSPPVPASNDCALALMAIPC